MAACALRPSRVRSTVQYLGTVPTLGRIRLARGRCLHDRAPAPDLPRRYGARRVALRQASPSLLVSRGPSPRVPGGELSSPTWLPRPLALTADILSRPHLEPLDLPPLEQREAGVRPTRHLYPATSAGLAGC